MRAMCLAITLSFFIACGGSGGGGGPPSNDLYEDDAKIVPSVFGTCEKLCCSDADCEGASCQAFDSALGTLGTCTTQPAAATPGALGAGCYLPADEECDPLAKTGCQAGEVCDFDPGDAQLAPVVMCFAGLDTLEAGETCDAVYGPACNSGYHCRTPPG
jgi:hypothetical protein